MYVNTVSRHIISLKSIESSKCRGLVQGKGFNLTSSLAQLGLTWKTC